MRVLINGVFINTFVSKWLEKDQVRVTSISSYEYNIKAHRELTLEEIKGAVVKYELSKQTKGIK